MATNMVRALPGKLSSQTGYPACLDQLTESMISEMAQDYLAQLTRLSGGSKLVIDKMPHVNGWIICITVLNWVIQVCIGERLNVSL